MPRPVPPSGDSSARGRRSRSTRMGGSRTPSSARPHAAPRNGPSHRTSDGDRPRRARGVPMTTEAIALPAAPAEDRGARPTALLPLTQLARIALFWLGLTAIDAAVATFISFRLAYSDLKGDLGLGAATSIIS